MKKILCSLTFMFVLFTTLLSTGGDISVNASSSSNEYNLFGLGQTVNIVKDHYLDKDDISQSETLFDITWLSERLESIDIVSDYNQESTPKISSGETIKELSVNYGINVKYDISLGGQLYEVVNALFKKEFELVTNGEINNYKHQFYYNYYGYYPRYNAKLSIDENETDYVANLSQTYEGYLNLLFRGAITPQVFFDKFGTHVITSGTYGGRFDYIYYSFNNQMEINNDLRLAAQQAISAHIDSKINGGVGDSFNFSTDIGYSNLTTYSNGYLKARGGDPTGVTSLDQLNSQLNNWLSSLNDSSSALIDIPENGLTPLWDLLPEQHLDQKEWFKEKCKQYIINNCEDFSEYGFDNELLDNEEYTDNAYHSIRSEEIKVDSDDEGDNSYDCIDLKFLTPIGYDLLKSEEGNYKTVTIEIQMDMKEENHGYQYIYLYKSNIDDPENYRMQSYQNELGHNQIIDNYTLQTIVFEDIDLNDIIDGKLYIKYGSSGIFQNDWFCKNIKVKVTYSK